MVVETVLVVMFVPPPFSPHGHPMYGQYGFDSLGVFSNSCTLDDARSGMLDVLMIMDGLLALKYASSE